MPRHDARQQLDRLIEMHGLTHAARGLHQISRTSIRIRPRPTPYEEVPVGASRLGGLPDLPASLAWPTARGRPLSFLAQIRLSEAGPHDASQLLPGRGFLWFFWDRELQPAGQEPSEKSSFRVLHEPDERVRLTRTSPAGKRRPELLPCARVQLAPEPSLPPEESHEAQVLDLSAEDWDQYYDLLSSLENTETLGTLTRHKLLGYSDPHQGDMRLDCQMVANGLSCTGEGAFRNPRVQELDRGIVDWQLLLQLDSDPELGWEFGEGGRLYFLIPLQALKAGSFEKVWAILQEPI